ncbi:hypothetical protein H4219_001724 [Mycoemilia scoparia]|uniref:Uncharacterized protein n=1 Tax=Mycoemilia scoparia TaxID=417184 RepID=A0A9W8DQ07_9FUNG|nr:hypothetical protein H4219_001724 [Mycoemilia scoparia]
MKSTSQIDAIKDIEEKCNKLIALIKDVHNSPKEKLSEITFSEISTLFLNLRQVNEHIQNELSDETKRVNNAKAEYERLKLRMENMVAEKPYLESEIKKMREIDMVFVDIPGMSVDLFNEMAPKELSAAQDPRQLKINQLKFELEQRKILVREIESARRHQRTLLEQKRKNYETLNGIHKRITNYIKSADSIKETLQAANPSHATSNETPAIEL